MGIKLTTLAHAAVEKRKVYVASLDKVALVTVRQAIKNKNHPYEIDYILTFDDGKSLKVYWDSMFCPHVIDSTDHEVDIDIGEESVSVGVDEAIA